MAGCHNGKLKYSGGLLNMATSKTAKVQAEIEKARAKLAEQQARIKELESKHMELENMEIVDIVRGLKIPLGALDKSPWLSASQQTG
jgi:soluble cytochrome b562